MPPEAPATPALALPAGYFSPHFSLAELTRSDIAERYGLTNEPGIDEMRNLRRLANFLELVRQLLGGRPILVSSGYRSRQVNTIVGGSASSRHMDGLAADFIAPRFGTPLQVCQAIARSELVDQLDELIFEGTWVHLALPPSGIAPRRYVGTAVFRKGLKPEFIKGLPK